MHDTLSRIGRWVRLLSVAGLAALAVACLGSTAALATGGQGHVITGDPDADLHVGVPTTFRTAAVR